MKYQQTKIKITLTRLFFTLLLFFNLPVFAQEEETCLPVLTLPGSELSSITATKLATLKGPELNYTACTGKHEGSIKNYTLFAIRGNEILYTKIFYGNNPGFDNETKLFLSNLNTGDTIFITNIFVRINKVPEMMSPLKVNVINENSNPKKLPSTSAERRITITETDDEPKKKGAGKPDTTLTSAFISEVKNGNIKAYNTSDFNEANQLSDAQIKSVFATRFDSLEVEDVDGTQIIKVIKKHFNYGSVNSLKVAAKWTSAENGEKKLKILGVAPVSDYYNDDGAVWAYKALFWLKYEDVKEIIEDYDSDNPDNNFTTTVNAAFIKGKK